MISSPGKQFGRTGTIRLVDTSSLHVVQRIHYPHGTPEGLAFSPDSATLAVGAWNGRLSESAVRLWDVVSGKPMTSSLPGIRPGDVMFATEFSPDGSTLVGGARVLGPERGRIYLWSLGTPAPLVDRFEARRPVNDLAFAPDGSLLMAPTGWADGGDLLIWDTGARTTLKTIHADDAAAYSVDVSNDGRTVVTGGQSSSVRLWDIALGAPLGSPLTGLTGSADTVDIGPDGSTVLGADTAGNVLLWDVATGTIIGDPFPGPASEEYLAASFTPDGRSVVVVSDAGSGWFWDVDPSDWKTRACQIAGRSLTPQEWQEFLPDRPYHATCGS